MLTSTVPSQITLAEALARYEVQKIDPKRLIGQEHAFANCMAFLDGVGKRRLINRNHTSYAIKHMVEQPNGQFDACRAEECRKQFTGYVCEGTLILAAFASGFNFSRVHPTSFGMHFNISSNSLREKCLSLCHRPDEL
jgi:hypothetical protein